MHTMGVNTKANTPSKGLQGMLNKKFWGKKKISPKGLAAKKDAAEKKAGEGSVKKALEKDED